jgi:hypothetical protein
MLVRMQLMRTAEGEEIASLGVVTQASPWCIFATTDASTTSASVLSPIPCPLTSGLIAGVQDTASVKIATGHRTHVGGGARSSRRRWRTSGRTSSRRQPS